MGYSLAAIVQWLTENHLHETLGFLVAVGIVTKLVNGCQRRYKVIQRKKQPPFPGVPYSVPDPHWYMGHAQLMGKDIVNGHRKVSVDHAGPTGVSTFWLFDTPMISILQAEDVRSVLRHSHERAQIPALTKHFRKLLGATSLILASGKEWKANRSIVHRAFLDRALIDATRSMVHTCVRVVNSILSNFENGQLKINIVDLCKMASLDTFGIAALGYDFECTANGRLEFSSIVRANEFFLKELTRRCFESPFNFAAQNYWFPSPANIRHRRESRKMRELILDIIKCRRQVVESAADMKGSFNEEASGNLLDHLLRGCTRSDGKVDLSDEYLSDFLVTMIFGGYETGSTCLACAFYLLSRHPDAQEECARESRRVLGEYPSYPLADFNPEDHLPYCCAVLFETLRLLPSVPATVRTLGRALELDVDGHKVEIPAKSRVFVSIWWAHHNEHNFARPDEFLPERWVRQNVDGSWTERCFNDSGDNDIPAANPNNLFAFSAGARACVGRPFAMRQMPIILASILRSCRVDLEDSNYKMEFVRSGPGQSPKGGISMIIRRRGT